MPKRVPRTWWSTMSRRTGSRMRSVSRVAGGGDVAADGVEEPERRVGGVIQALALAVRKHVGDQPVAHVAREGPQDERRFAGAAGSERQPFEADHRVAAPVGEPVIAGDHRARLGAERHGPRRVFGPRGRRDEELIGGQHQLRRTGRTAAGPGACSRTATRRAISVWIAGSGVSASTVSHDSVEATSVASGRAGSAPRSTWK